MPANASQISRSPTSNGDLKPEVLASVADLVQLLLKVRIRAVGQNRDSLRVRFRCLSKSSRRLASYSHCCCAGAPFAPCSGSNPTFSPRPEALDGPGLPVFAGCVFLFQMANASMLSRRRSLCIQQGGVFLPQSRVKISAREPHHPTKRARPYRRRKSDHGCELCAQPANGRKWTINISSIDAFFFATAEPAMIKTTYQRAVWSSNQ
jgi:hypothetical protein